MDFIRQFKVDIALIGISGIEPDGSLRDFDYREVKVAQTIIEQALRGLAGRRPQQVQPPGHGAIGHASNQIGPAVHQTRRRPEPFPCFYCKTPA